MFRFFALSVLAAVPVAAVHAQYGYSQSAYYSPPARIPAVPASRLDRQVDGSHAYNMGRSAEVPTAEASRPFMTLITSDHYQQNQRERDLVSWFNTNPRLAKLRTTCRCNWYTSAYPHFRDQLRLKCGEALPIVAIQRPDGQAILNVTGLSMPRTSGELADMCDDALNQAYAAPGPPGQSATTQITDDCGPDCNPNYTPPSLEPDDARIEPIPEVIPQRPLPFNQLTLALGVLALGLFVALLVVVLLIPRSSAAGHAQIY